MGVLSKFVASTLGLRLMSTNCYETAHVWNPSCTGAIKDASVRAFVFSFRTYFTLYLLSSLVAVRDPRKLRWRRLIGGSARSSLFLSMNLFLYLWWMCRIRHLLGFYTLPTLGLTNGLLSSFMAILIEQKKRRPMLALYLTNLASETAFRQLVNHGYLRTVPRGEALIFAIGIAGFVHLYRRKQLDEGTAKVVSLCLKLESNTEILDSRRFPAFLRRALVALRTRFARHAACKHRHSCASVAVESFSRNFAVGFAVSSILTLLRSIGSLWNRPSALLRTLVSKDNFRLPLFFGLLPALFHGSECWLNRKFNGQSSAIPWLSGFIGGLSMLVFPHLSIAMYIFWKWIETGYFLLSDAGYVPYWKHGDTLLYTLSTGYVLFNASIEPQAMRRGYFNFLMGLTGGKLGLFNRKLIDQYGFQSSQMFPGYFPTLDPKYVTINPASYGGKTI